MKYMKFFFIIFFFYSCKLFTDNNSEYPEYISNKLWTTEISTSRISFPIQDGQYIYGYEILEYADKKNSTKTKDCVFKLDLDTGDFVWKSDAFDSDCFNEHLLSLSNGILYRYIGNGIILCFDEKTGKKKSTVQFRIKESDEPAYIEYPIFIITKDGEYLLYNYTNDGNSINDDGIMKVSIHDIDFNGDPEITQIIYPDMIWCGETKDLYWNREEHVSSTLKEDNGYVYFKTCAQFSDGNHTRFGCIEIKSGKLLWIRNLDGFAGSCYETFYILDDKIYIFEKQIGCFNKYTGETIWEHVQTEQDIINDICYGNIAFNSAGVFYDEGFFYYVTTDGYMAYETQGRDLDKIGNMKCLNARTGEMKWQFLTGNCGSSWTRPVVIKNKVFVLPWGTGLWVFEKKNGKVLGVDKSVNSIGDDRNYTWNGNFIYFNNDDENNTRILTCIKP